MLIQGVAQEIALIDVHKEKAEGEAMDLEHGLLFLPEAKITFGDSYELCKDADVIVITAGLAQKQGESRLDLVNKNIAIFKDIIPKITKYAGNSIILVVTNPVDIMTYVAYKLSGLNKNKVFGSGTALDTARLRYYVGNYFDIAPHNVHAFVLGEHGDSEFPIWSRATVAGLRINEVEGFKQTILSEIHNKTKNAVYEVISKKGATYYAIGLVISKIVKAILHNQHDVMPLSVYLDNYYDEGNICMSIPCVVGKEGIIRRMQLPLTQEEQQSLHKSASVLKEIISNIKL